VRKALRRILWKRGGFHILLAVQLAELPLRILVGALARLVPRDRHLFAFGAERDRFGDNAAYLYLSAQSQADHFVWITGSPSLVERLRSAGLAAERRWSYRGVLTCLRAGSFVISSYASDVNDWFADGTRLVNLWHGVPLKRIERDIASGPLQRLYEDRQPMKAAFRYRTRPPDLLLAPSAYIAERCFTSAFAIPCERCLPFGYPRTDHFFERRDTPPHELLISDPAVWRGVERQDRVVGYFPTWREGRTAESAPGGLDLEQFAADLAKLGGHLVFKSHFITNAASPIPSATVLGQRDDANAYLPLCDVLVTDYSSLAFDFMLLDRPIVYFVPDLDDYERDRGFYFDPLEMMPGSIVPDPGQLIGAITTALEEGPDPRLRKVRQRVWGDYSGGASTRLGSALAESTRSTTL
jgi:CDP-glycerol glycerophosphotransferase (TagB/SpsB family)